MTRILIVEDDAQLRASLTLQLEDAGYAVESADSITRAEEVLEGDPVVDLVLLDVRLGGDSGVDWIEQRDPDGLPPTIVMSGEATMDEAVRAMRHGVIDFVEKPFTRERILRSLELALELLGLRRHVEELEESSQPLIGRSPKMLQLLERIGKAAKSTGTVLIQGESGTGKELIANALHLASSRSSQELVRLNCAAIPTTLIEDELFGHVKGAFTDARASKPGLFEVADGGTLFLDEIGDMELELQSRLLRVLEDGRIRRVGDTRERSIDVRVVCATHRDLETLPDFRKDLFFRIAELRLEVPPLRERSGDIRLLFEHFLERACQQQRVRRKTPNRALVEAIERYSWPGNVRELKNVCTHLAVFGGTVLDVDDLPSSCDADDDERRGTTLLRLEEIPRGLSLRDFKAGSEREFLEVALRRVNWNFSRAAEELGVARTHLHDRARKLGIRRPGKSEPEEPS